MVSLFHWLNHSILDNLFYLSENNKTNSYVESNWMWLSLKSHTHTSLHNVCMYPLPIYVCPSIWWYCCCSWQYGLDKRNVIIMLTPIRNVIKMKILLKLVVCRCHRRIIIFYQISAHSLPRPPTPLFIPSYSRLHSCTFIRIVDSPQTDFNDFCCLPCPACPPSMAPCLLIILILLRRYVAQIR